MSNGPLPTVLRWSAYAKTSGAKYHIPPAVLLALVHVESGGNEGETSPTGAQGLTQFEPATARSYGVNVAPGHAQSQIEGAAHYLHDLGFSQNPALALAKYNAGPVNPAAGAGYAKDVLGVARLYGGKLPAAPPASQAASNAPAAGDGSTQLIDAKKRSGAVQALLTVGFVGFGTLLIWQGTNTLTGGTLSKAASAAKTVAKVGAAAA